MLIELYGRNFGCFRDDFKLSMLATDIDPDTDRGLVEAQVEGHEPLSLLRAVALYGPNASGKSTVLRAAGALRHLVGASFGFTSDEELQPYEPFALGPNSNQPVQLGAKVIVEGRIYDYSIGFNDEAFVQEKLVHLGHNNQEVLLYRTHQHVEGKWVADPQFQLLAKNFRRNALLLSLADSLVPGLDKGIAVALQRLLATVNPISGYGWPPDRSERVAERARDDSEFGGWLLARLRSADVGVVEVNTEEVKRFVRVRRNPLTPPREVPEGDKEVRISYRLALLHGGAGLSVALPYSRESLGTQRLVELSPLLYDLTHSEEPRAAFVDEFDASMHPLLLQSLVRHFNCEIPMNVARGQLVFATHETLLLDDEAKDNVLRRDQVYFTEKDASGAARLFSLADVKERNNLNVRRRYLQGRYGALPSIGTFAE